MIDPDDTPDDAGTDKSGSAEEPAATAPDDSGSPAEEATGAEEEESEAGSSPESTESPWARLFAGESHTESPVEALVRERFERLAADVLHKRLGASVQEDGTADLTGVTQEQFSESMPDLGVDMLKTYLSAIKPALGQKADVGEDGEPLENPFEGVDLDPAERAHLKQASEDIQLVLGMMGKSADEAKDDVMRLVERIKEALGERLGDVLNALGGSSKKVGGTPFTKQAVQNALGDRLIGLMRQLGNVVEASRRRGVRLEPFAGPAPHAPPPTAPDTTIDSAPVPEPAQASAEEGTAEGGGGEVIFLEEVRKRLDDKREKLSGLDDVLAKIFTDASGGSASSGGPMSLNLDQDFFKEHGPALLQRLVEGISKNIVPKKVELTLPMTPEEQPPSKGGEGSEADEGTTEAADASKPAVKVSVNLNLANLLGGLFRSRSPGSEDQ